MGFLLFIIKNLSCFWFNILLFFSRLDLEINYNLKLHDGKNYAFLGFFCSTSSWHDYAYPHYRLGNTISTNQQTMQQNSKFIVTAYKTLIKKKKKSWNEIETGERIERHKCLETGIFCVYFCNWCLHECKQLYRHVNVSKNDK